MKRSLRNRDLTIAFLINAPADPLSLIAFTCVFCSPKIEGRPAYRIVTLSANARRTEPAISGFNMSNCIPYTEYGGRIDTLVIIGGETRARPVSPELTRWLRRQATPTKRIVCVGTGVFTLAATGLLDKKRVTTHWHHIELLAETFPDLQVERSPIFVTDGNIYSTAGAIAAIDAALALVEEDHGHSVAACVARDLVVYMRRSGSEKQYSNVLAQQTQIGGTLMRDLPAWTKAHIAERLDVSALAKVVAMTPRTFARQFEAHFRTTPARWVQSLRVEAACTLIEAEELPLKAIASATGFRDEQSLRRAFIQQLSMTPKQYRERYDASTSCMTEDLAYLASGNSELCHPSISPTPQCQPQFE